mmetsp:Transcript_3374/g.2825  ORF Transcript_3374/g.2825 Transcript_3374/m.2825 type:complete len:91 (-) Transcript_3374:35-307(-)
MAEKKKEKETELENVTDKDEDDIKLSEKSGKSKGVNETTAMGLKGEGSHIMNRSREKEVEEIKETNGVMALDKDSSLNDYSAEEEKEERM